MDDITGKTGTVLVLGTGIAGAQASLDLAEAGFRVYLADRNPAIGGRLAQPDKVFPADDCSICTVSPKLTDAGMHLNKETLNLAELVGLEGHPGRFTARLRVSPRYLDATKCTACGDCAAVCPVSLPSEFIQGLEPRKAVFKSYPQAVPNAFSLSKGPVNPCVTECPAGVNAHAYVSLASEGRYREALEVILDTLPLPGTLTRICARPCEARCRRDLMEGPLAIRDIIRLVTDHADLCGGGRHPRGTHWPAAHGDSRRGPGRALLRLPPGQDRDRLHRLRGQGRFRRRPPDGHPRLPPPADGAGQGRNFPAMGTSSSSATWP